MNKRKERNTDRFAKLTRFPSSGGMVPENTVKTIIFFNVKAGLNQIKLQKEKKKILHKKMVCKEDTRRAYMYIRVVMFPK